MQCQLYWKACLRCGSCNGTLILLAAHLLACFPAGNLVQTSLERVTLDKVPLDVVCDVVGIFEHVKELKCTDIRDPQQVCLCNVTPSPRPHVTPSPRHHVTPSPRPHVTPSPRPHVTPSPRPHVIPSPRPQVTPSPRPHVIPSPMPHVTSLIS